MKIGDANKKKKGVKKKKNLKNFGEASEIGKGQKGTFTSENSRENPQGGEKAGRILLPRKKQLGELSEKLVIRIVMRKTKGGPKKRNPEEGGVR